MKIYKTLTLPLAATALIALPATAHAGEKSRARDAITEADVRIQTAWAAGAGDSAPGPQARATAALDRARHQLRKSNERHAYYAAREAQAYASLALAAAQNQH